MSVRAKFRSVSQSAMAALLVLSACADVRDAPVSASAEADALAVEKFLATLDKTTLPADTLADLYLEDAVILRPGLPEVRGREAIVALMKEQAAGPALEMTHRADEITRFDDILVVQGGVTGVARPTDGSGPFPFATQNIILFKRDAQGEPKIWKVIFNAAPQEG